MENSKKPQANGLDQRKIVFNAFFDSPKTMQEVSIETGVMRSNICYYIRDFRNQRQIELVGYRKCNVTKYGKVGIYTTNPDLFPISNQLKLF